MQKSSFFHILVNTCYFPFFVVIVVFNINSSCTGGYEVAFYCGFQSHFSCEAKCYSYIFVSYFWSNPCSSWRLPKQESIKPLRPSIIAQHPSCFILSYSMNVSPRPIKCLIIFQTGPMLYFLPANIGGWNTSSPKRGSLFPQSEALNTCPHDMHHIYFFYTDLFSSLISLTEQKVPWGHRVCVQSSISIIPTSTIYSAWNTIDFQ